MFGPWKVEYVDDGKLKLIKNHKRSFLDQQNCVRRKNINLSNDPIKSSLQLIGMKINDREVLFWSKQDKSEQQSDWEGLKKKQDIHMDWEAVTIYLWQWNLQR